MGADSASHYPIERRAGEIERLLMQGDSMAGETAVMLDRIGVGPGWACLDIGCGPEGITPILAERVGPQGRVVGLDADPVFIAHARSRAPANTQFLVDNAYASSLASASFDLVHMRFLASTAGRPHELLREAMRLARPGAVVAIQEPDVERLAAFPSCAAFDRLKDAMIGAFTSAGTDINLGQKLFALAREAGLVDPVFRPFLLGFRACDPMRDYLPLIALSLSGTILGRGLMTEAELHSCIDGCRAHLADPGTVSTLYGVAQVWGRTPSH